MVGEHHHDNDCGGHNDDNPLSVAEKFHQDRKDEEAGDDEPEHRPDHNHQNIGIVITRHIGVHIPGFLIVIQQPIEKWNQK